MAVWLSMVSWRTFGVWWLMHVILVKRGNHDLENSLCIKKTHCVSQRRTAEETNLIRVRTNSASHAS